MNPVVIVDDEPDIVELVVINLERAGFAAKGFTEPGEFLKFLANHSPALAILDLMLPGIDGFDICKRMKQDSRLSSVPVIMLTAKNEVNDKILGLELGADDYITKPFSPLELVARVKSVLRRNAGEKKGKVMEIGGGALTIDLEKYCAVAGGQKIELTATEFRILELLASKKEHVFSREAILDHLWGSEKIVVDRTIDVHVKHLRAKLGAAGGFIKSVRGIGYKIEAGS
ncbi:MAG: two-component system response regulator [Elusimicrobia bacterium RIFOXYA2_FULL_50_26]|nr:MAG: two-component system response regulator [Elusimicrobia bacterium RIFOXYA2_FULL_50_26]OGS22817.1 MAG: two-component system response regulator [Elusimicrobia bacterium RIFOXYB2_FULL_50_12]